MTVENFWLIGVLATLILFVTIETSASNEIKTNNENYQELKVFDLKKKGKKLKIEGIECINGNDAGNDLEIKTKPILKKSKVSRMLIEPKTSHNWERSSIVDEGGEKIYQENERYQSRVKRNATELNEFKGGKKNHKKLKLAQTQAGYKNWKNKERSSDLNGEKYIDKTKKKINRRHVDNFGINKNRTNRLKRYAVTKNSKDDKSDYYAQRKAVMERFHARQKQIAEKYAKIMSTTPKYIYRYNLDRETDKNNVTSSNKTETNNIDKRENPINSTNKDLSTSTFTTSTTKAEEQITEAVTEVNRDSRSNQVQTADNSPEDTIEEDKSEDYDYYTLEDSKLKPVFDTTLNGNSVLNDGEWMTDDSRKDILKWGTCSGKVVYQHNLIIGINNAAAADADLSTSLEGPYCITCIRVIPMNKNKAKVSFDVSRRQDGSFSLVKINFKGFQDEELSYIVKVWAVSKRYNRCDHV